MPETLSLKAYKLADWTMASGSLFHWFRVRGRKLFWMYVLVSTGIGRPWSYSGGRIWFAWLAGHSNQLPQGYWCFWTGTQGGCLHVFVLGFAILVSATFLLRSPSGCNCCIHTWQPFSALFLACLCSRQCRDPILQQHTPLEDGQGYCRHLFWCVLEIFENFDEGNQWKNLLLFRYCQCGYSMIVYYW